MEECSTKSCLARGFAVTRHKGLSLELDVKDFIETHQADFLDIRPLVNNRVYVLTDDALLADALVIDLGPDNFQLKIFNEPEALRALCQRVPPAAILLDKDDPTTGGPDASSITSLKQQLDPCPPIISISAATDLDNRLAAARAGCTRYFPKPLNLGMLSRTLRGFGSAELAEPYRVLLIDDNAEILFLFASQLLRGGLKVETATDAHQGLRLLTSFQPDLLLLDINMPNISGAELVQVIRQDDNFAQLPILYLSMDDSSEQQQAIMNLGGDEFLSKQIDGERLVARVTEQIRRAREAKRVNLGLREALWNSELRRFALDNHAIVSASDVNGNITYVNDTFCKISGYRRDELMGKNHRLLKSGHHPESFYTEMWVAITQGETWQGTICNRCKDGREYWVESTIVPFLDHNGLPYQYVSVRTDITELRANQDRLHRSQVFANIGTWDWNIQTGELFWSERIGPLFGYQAAIPETTYANFIAAVHPEDRRLLINAINRCVEQGDDYDIEHRVVWPDGTVHWMMERGDVIRDEHGMPLHMLGVVQDITQRKQMESELLKYKAAMDGSLEGIAIIDASGKYRYVNPALASIYGYAAPEELADHYWSEHYSATELLRFEEEVMHKLVCAHQWSGEAVGQRKNGSAFPQLLSLSTLKDGDLVCIVHDISASKQVESELVSAKEAAEQASQAKSQFLSSMSHELRTPMNAIIGFGQLLELEPLTEVQQDDVGEILKAGSHLLELINEVLDLSRVEADHLDLTIEDVPLDDVLMECITLITPLAENNDINFIATHNGDKISFKQGQQWGAVLRADRTRLKQALINLLSNAVKYNNAHGKVTIDCRAAENGRMRISITDTGLGITPEQHSQLFQPFNRLGAENTEIEGTGIGLVYTKKIIELMDGSVGVKSIPGEGCTFWIDVPGYYRSLAILDNEDKEKKDAAPSSVRNEMPPRFTVLYVEDNPANMRLMEQMLKRRNDIYLLQAHEPLLGLELASKYKPDLIMLDINLPGMSGYDVLQILRESKTAREIPVIAISANAMPSDIQKGLDLGFSHYITKPIKLQSLFDVLDEVLAKTQFEVEG